MRYIPVFSKFSDHSFKNTRTSNTEKLQRRSEAMATRDNHLGQSRDRGRFGPKIIITRRSAAEGEDPQPGRAQLQDDPPQAPTVQQPDAQLQDPPDPPEPTFSQQFDHLANNLLEEVDKDQEQRDAGTVQAQKTKAMVATARKALDSKDRQILELRAEVTRVTARYNDVKVTQNAHIAAMKPIEDL